jgi:hypothetical protein
MQVLVCEQRDLAAEAAERSLLDRSSDEIGARDQRDGDGRENGRTDGEPQAGLK